MKFESKIFISLGLFFIPIGIIYGYLTQWKELVGFPAIEMVAMLCLIVGLYLNSISNLIGSQPEDDINARIEDGFGEIGFFPPHSLWPLLIGISGMFIALGLALDWWIFYIGFFGAIFSVIGWIFEYGYKRESL